MSPAYIEEKLSTLPRLTIENIDRQAGQARFDLRVSGFLSGSVSTTATSTYLYLANLDYFEGELCEESDDKWYRTVETSRYTVLEGAGPLRLGLELALFPYDRRRLLLVLDPELSWERVNFQPQRALMQRILGKDGSSLIKQTLYLGQEPIPKGAWIEEGSWDHEHCIFCLTRIDIEKPGYNSVTDKHDEWACMWCYINAIQPHQPKALWTAWSERSLK